MKSLQKLCRRLGRTARGAIDLVSIMVGVLVITIIGAVIATTVFAVIPWTQDEAAKGDLRALNEAQRLYRAGVPTGSGAGVGRLPTYGSLEALVAAGLLPEQSRLGVSLGDAGLCFVGSSRSDTGRVFFEVSTATAGTPRVVERGSTPPAVPECPGADVTMVLPPPGACDPAVAWTVPDHTLHDVVTWALRKAHGAKLTLADACAFRAPQDMKGTLHWPGAETGHISMELQSYFDAHPGPVDKVIPRPWKVADWAGIEFATTLVSVDVDGRADRLQQLPDSIQTLRVRSATGAAAEVIRRLPNLGDLHLVDPTAEVSSFADLAGAHPYALSVSGGYDEGGAQLTAHWELDGVEGLTRLRYLTFMNTDVSDISSVPAQIEVVVH